MLCIYNIYVYITLSIHSQIIAISWKAVVVFSRNSFLCVLYIIYIFSRLVCVHFLLMILWKIMLYAVMYVVCYIYCII